MHTPKRQSENEPWVSILIMWVDAFFHTPGVRGRLPFISESFLHPPTLVPMTLFARSRVAKGRKWDWFV